VKRARSAGLVLLTGLIELAAVTALILQDVEGYHELRAKAEGMASR
jgi:hypothetical protein